MYNACGIICQVQMLFNFKECLVHKIQIYNLSIQYVQLVSHTSHSQKSKSEWTEPVTHIWQEYSMEPRTLPQPVQSASHCTNDLENCQDHVFGKTDKVIGTRWMTTNQAIAIHIQE